MSATLLGFPTARHLAAGLIRDLPRAHDDPDCRVDLTVPGSVGLRWEVGARRFELCLAEHWIVGARRESPSGPVVAFSVGASVFSTLVLFVRAELLRLKVPGEGGAP